VGKSIIAVYPGTFDPITNGHVDIVGRAAKLVDKLVIGVAANPGKNPMFSLAERVDMVRADTEPAKAQTEIALRSFDNLLVDFAAEEGARMIVRGLRAVSDFEFEFQMVGTNARLNPDIETLFLMASEHHQFISSRFVKEIAKLGGDVSSFVSPAVTAHLTARVADLAERPYSSS
jgi:pantetheine-phosphate adenylyltransferase